MGPDYTRGVEATYCTIIRCHNLQTGTVRGYYSSEFAAEDDLALKLPPGGRELVHTTGDRAVAWEEEPSSLLDLESIALGVWLRILQEKH